MAPTAIVSYDDTLNDLDALALARVLATAGTTLTLAYVRHTTQTQRDREMLEENDAETLLARGARWLGDLDVARRVVVSASTGAGLGWLAEQEDADIVVFGSDYRTAPGHVSPQQSAVTLLEGGPGGGRDRPGELSAERRPAVRARRAARRPRRRGGRPDRRRARRPARRRRDPRAAEHRPARGRLALGGAPRLRHDQRAGAERDRGVDRAGVDRRARRARSIRGASAGVSVSVEIWVPIEPKSLWVSWQDQVAVAELVPQVAVRRALSRRSARAAPGRRSPRASADATPPARASR